MTSRPASWNVIATRICCRPPTTRRGEEVAHGPGLRRRERLGPVVRDRLGVLAGPAAQAPAVVVVPVEVGPDRARSRRRLAVLAPEVEVAALDVELRAVGVHREHDPDLARVDDRGDPRARPVAVGQPVEDVQGHLEAHVLVGVVEAVEQDLGLVLVGPDVVADLGRPQLAALVRSCRSRTGGRCPGARRRRPGCPRPSPGRCGSPSSRPGSPGRRAPPPARRPG